VESASPPTDSVATAKVLTLMYLRRTARFPSTRPADLIASSVLCGASA
jgi:hypothetical protein